MLQTILFRQLGKFEYIMNIRYVINIKLLESGKRGIVIM